MMVSGIRCCGVFHSEAMHEALVTICRSHISECAWRASNWVLRLFWHLRVILLQARIQKGGAGGKRPPLFAPNSLKSPLNWPKKS